MLKGKKIKKYRESAKRLGIWDKNYSSIKSEFSSIMSNIEARDFAMDIIGSTFYQMLLVARLAIYGESETDLSNEDLKVLYSQLDSLENLYLTPYVLANGIDSLINNVFPFFFRTMDECGNMREFELEVRKVISESLKVTNIGLSYGISLVICMRKYPGMDKHVEPLNDKLSTMLGEKDVVKKILDAIALKMTTKKEESYYLFPALLATAIVEENLGRGVDYPQMYEFINSIHNMAREVPDMYDFITSGEFRFLMNSVEKYHEL